jgi:hypothetical protein
MEFLKYLALRHDVLDKLTNLSPQVKERFCTTRGAEKAIKEKFWLLELMVERKEKLFKHQDA